MLLINAGAQADNLAHASPYLINTTPMIADEVDVLTRYMMAHNLKTAAILYENDSAGISGRDDFVAAYAKAGGRIVGQEPIDFGQTDFRPDLLRLAAGKPDAVFVNLTVATQPLADQYHQLGLPFVVVGTSFFADPTLIADPAANGWIHTQVKIDASPDLVASFQDKYHAPMDFHVRQWYNGATVLLTAIQRVVSDNQPVTGENLLKAIFAIRRFQGLIPMEFDTNTASVPISINKFQDGKDVEIENSTNQ